MNNFKDLSGQTFNYLTVLHRDINPKHKRVMWKCLCVCGNTSVVAGNDLKKLTIKSCGCMQHGTQNFKHGLKHTRQYTIWAEIKKRCFNPNCKDFKNYGGRGITVCDEWRYDFLAFYNWASDNGYSDTLSIDRIDVNGNYEPSNCRWATRIEQQNNRRDNAYLEHNGTVKSLADWCRTLDINYKSAYEKYRRSMLKTGKASFATVFPNLEA